MARPPAVESAVVEKQVLFAGRTGFVKPLLMGAMVRFGAVDLVGLADGGSDVRTRSFRAQHLRGQWLF